MKTSSTTSKLISILILVIWIHSFSQKNYAQIINPGFETAIISPWIGTYTATTSTGMTVLSWTVNPAGSYMGSLMPTYGFMISNAETNLGLSSGSLVSFNSELFNLATNFGTITQNIHLEEGQSFQVNWNYISQDYAPFNDGIIATLVGPSSYKVIHLLAVTSNAYGDPEAILTGNYGSTDWHSISFTAGPAGNYKLGFACFNTGDQSVNPILLLDNAPGGTSAPGEPILTTTNITNITTNTAFTGGNIISDGGSTVTERGVCWNTSSLPTISSNHTLNGTGTGIFTSNLTGLTSGTTYYVRAYAKNSVGTVYGNELVFTTTSNVPSDPSSISATSNSICNGESTQLTANGAVGTVYWYSGSCGGTLVATGNPIIVSPTSSTTYYAKNYNGIFSNGCVSTVITVNPVSVGGNVSGGTTICSGSTSDLLILSDNIGNILKWQYSISPFTTWTDIANNASTYTSPNLTKTTQFRAIVQSGSCSPVASSATTVTVGDSINPTIICQSNISTTVTAGLCSKSVLTTNPITDDNCSISKLTWTMTGATTANSPDSGINNVGTYIFNLGLTTVTYTVYDEAGNSANSSFTVTVIDDVNPVAITKNISVYLNNTGNAIITVTDINNGSYDNCSIASMNVSKTNFTCADLGLNNVILTVVDGSGNISTAVSVVTVIDNLSPVANVANLPDITGECFASVVAPTATDNCAGPIIATTSDSLFYHTQGTYIINWIYNDGNGNSSSQTQKVVIDDITAPIADISNLPNIIGECEASVLIIPTATDNCTGTVIASTTDLLTYVNQGTFTIHWIYNDGNGNITTQNQNVIIHDDNTPIPDISNLPDITGECSAAVVGYPTATDNCAGIITATTTDPLLYYTQGSYIVNWKYDDGMGNTLFQLQNVIIADVTSPVPDIANLPDIFSECSITVVAPTATDNCKGTIIATTSDPLYYNEQGSYVITWNYDDGNGNISSQIQNVIISDVSSPVPDIANLPDIFSECSATVVAPTATDNCTGAIIATTSDPLTYSEQGFYTITWNYNDGNGNISSQIQNIMIFDTTPPVPDMATLVDIKEECYATVVAPTATDNCTGTITATTSDPLTYSEQGFYTITWNYNDGNGNISSQLQTVIVNDVTAPTCNPFPDIFTCDGKVNNIAPNGVLDNCSSIVIITYELSGATIGSGYDDASKEFFNPGVTIVTYALIDENGNSSKYSFLVSHIVIDASVTISGITLIANGIGTYQWYDCVNNIPLIGETSQSFTPSMSGEYSVIISNNGCTDTSDCYRIIFTDIQDISNNSEFETSLYPNPTTGIININSNITSVDLKICIIDITGQEVINFSSLKGKSNVINVEKLNPGIYFVKIFNQQNQKIIKLIKQ